MPEIKILTDINIPQCPKWGNETVFLYGTSKRLGRLRSFLMLVKLGRYYDVVVTAGTLGTPGLIQKVAAVVGGGG